jgi:hypothetical protein
VEALVIYALLTSSAFYLGSRAVITRALWSRYPRWLASWADCAACSGAWYGAGFALLLRDKLAHPFGAGIPGPILVGLCSIVSTPIVAGLMQAGFERLGSAVEDPDDQ